MNSLRCIAFLLIAATLASAQRNHPSELPQQPEELIRSLYQQVVAHHPIGIPLGAEMKIFAPYMSNALLHKIDEDIACLKDWDRQYPDPNLKPPIYEGGIFSGDDERASPRSFEIERTELENDGSVRVFVGLTWGSPPEKPTTWEVAPIVVEETGHLVVDDVIFLKDGDWLRTDMRMSEILSEGCDGPLWVGERRKDTGQKP